MAYSWTYDGGATLTLTYTNFPSNVDVYQFAATDDLSDTPQFGTITAGSSGTLVAHNIGFNPGNGPSFEGLLINNDGSVDFTRQTFTYGTPFPAPVGDALDLDPLDAPGEYFRIGAFEAQNGVKKPKSVDPLYQAFYDDGFAFGSYLDSQINKFTM